MNIFDIIFDQQSLDFLRGIVIFLEFSSPPSLFFQKTLENVKFTFILDFMESNKPNINAKDKQLSKLQTNLSLETENVLLANGNPIDYDKAVCNNVLSNFPASPSKHFFSEDLSS